MEGTDTLNEQPSPPKKRKKAKGTKLGRKLIAAAKPVKPPRRTARLDIRMTKENKARVAAKAKKLKTTISKIVMEAVESIK